jgi:hypothetical protein
MLALLKNRLALLSTSFALFLVAVPLISAGSTGGPRPLLWVGFAALCVATLIPPAWRLLCGPKAPSDDEGAGEDEPEATNRKEGQP